MRSVAIQRTSTIRIPPVRRELSNADCGGCGTPLLVPPGEYAVCNECREQDIRAKARELVGEVRALQQGLPPYNELSPAEREEQLQQLGIAPQDVTTAEILASIPGMSDRELIDLAGAYPMGASGYSAQIMAAAADELSRRLQPMLDGERWDGLG